MKQHLLLLILFIFCGSIYAQEIQKTIQPERGVAIVYDQKLIGQKTASGERYDPKIRTAAHDYLPFGTLVQVKNIETNKGIDVTINDKGTGGNLIALSARAAKDLGVTNGEEVEIRVMYLAKNKNRPEEYDPHLLPDDIDVPPIKPDARINQPKPKLPTTKVKEEIIEKPSTKPTVSEESTAKKEVAPSKAKTVKPKIKPAVKKPKKVIRPTAKPISSKKYNLYRIRTAELNETNYGVQVASYESHKLALNKVQKLQARWFKKIFISTPDKSSYKVVLGIYDDRIQAEAYKKSLSKKGVKGFVVEYPKRSIAKNNELYLIKEYKPEGYAVQVATYTNYKYALDKITELQSKFYDNTYITVHHNNGKPVYKILINQYEDRDRAEAYSVRLRRKGIAGFVVNLGKM